jgi:hypothetical protein
MSAGSFPFSWEFVTLQPRYRATSWWLRPIAALLLCSVALSSAIAANAPIRAMYIVSGAFERGWRDGLGVPSVLATRQDLESAMAHSTADIKRLGFNAIILDPMYFPGRSDGFEEYAKVAIEAAASSGIGVLLGIPPRCPAASPDCLSRRAESDAATMNSCMDGPEQRGFVDRFADEPALTGFSCAFENFGQPTVTPEVLARMRALTEYIRSKGKIFLDVPAAGRQQRARGAFSLLTPELNPKLFATPTTMLREVATDAARDRGVEINFWHSQTVPQYGYPGGPSGTAKWHQLQYDAVVRVGPRNLTVFDYQKVIAANDDVLQFYRPRGWLMSLTARLDDRSLVFYDPLESQFASTVMHVEPVGVRYTHDGLGGFLRHDVDGGAAWIGHDGGLLVPMAIDAQGGRPLVSQEAGTFSAWIKADWGSASGTVHGVLQVPCPDPGHTCLQLRIVGADMVELSLRDASGAQVVATAPLAGAWNSGAWNHVAATWDRAGRLALYLDGRRVGAAQGAWTATPAPPEILVKQRITIGNLGGSASAGAAGLDGEIDEVRLYSRAMAAGEIARLRNAVTGH